MTTINYAQAAYQAYANATSLRARHLAGDARVTIGDVNRARTLYEALVARSVGQKLATATR